MRKTKAKKNIPWSWIARSLRNRNSMHQKSFRDHRSRMVLLVGFLAITCEPLKVRRQVNLCKKVFCEIWNMKKSNFGGITPKPLPLTDFELHHWKSTKTKTTKQSQNLSKHFFTRLWNFREMFKHLANFRRISINNPLNFSQIFLRNLLRFSSLYLSRYLLEFCQDFWQDLI